LLANLIRFAPAAILSIDRSKQAGSQAVTAEGK